MLHRLFFKRFIHSAAFSLLLPATSLTITSSITSTAHADTIFGIYAGVQSWNSQFSGDFGTIGDTEIDVDDTLGLDDEGNTAFYIALEHPIPMIPNIKLRQSTIDYEETDPLNTPITFLSETLPAGEISSNIDLSHTDITLYYELLDNWVSLDLGVTARQFDGRFQLTSIAETTDAELDETIALFYAAAQFELPFTGFYARAEGNTLSLDDHSHTDLSVALGYESSFRFGAELGYRFFTLDLEELSVGSDKLNSNLDLSGLFLGLTLHI